MDGGNLLFDRPQRRLSEHASAPASPGPTQRRQPIRDAILCFLAEPRRAKDIARHIERRTCIATGHLRAMQAKGLVVRLSWGVWIRRDRCGCAPDPGAIRRDNPAQDRLLRHLHEPKTLDDLVRITGQSRMALQSALTKMVKRAVVERLDGRKFAAVTK